MIAKGISRIIYPRVLQSEISLSVKMLQEYVIAPSTGICLRNSSWIEPRPPADTVGREREGEGVVGLRSLKSAQCYVVAA
jgi:hypothetical protein